MALSRLANCQPTERTYRIARWAHTRHQVTWFRWLMIERPRWMPIGGRADAIHCSWFGDRSIIELIITISLIVSSWLYRVDTRVDTRVKTLKEDRSLRKKTISDGHRSKWDSEQWEIDFFHSCIEFLWLPAKIGSGDPESVCSGTRSVAYGGHKVRNNNW